MSNLENNTIVSGKMLEELRKQGLADGYTQVPEKLVARANSILNGRDIADIDEPTKRELIQAGNAKREAELAAGRESVVVKAQIAAREKACQQD